TLATRKNIGSLREARFFVGPGISQLRPVLPRPGSGARGKEAIREGLRQGHPNPGTADPDRPPRGGQIRVPGRSRGSARRTAEVWNPDRPLHIHAEITPNLPEIRLPDRVG